MMGNGKPLSIDEILRSAGKGEQPLVVELKGQDGKAVKMDWRLALITQLSVIDANTKAIQVAIEKIAEGSDDAKAEAPIDQPGGSGGTETPSGGKSERRGFARRYERS